VATETIPTPDRTTTLTPSRVTSSIRRPATPTPTPTLAVLAVIALVVCQPAYGQSTPAGARPGTGGDSSRAPASAPQSDGARPLYSPADVRFMQGMIAHHAQALAMVALIPPRTSRQDMHLLGKRIEISQRDEISLMQHWLEDRHQEVPKVDAHHVALMPGMQMQGALMPGMLTDEQMAQLAKATGPDFDRLFLEGMIRHHEGALVMVSHLFDTNGAGQEAEAFRFASDVDADQRAEIRRMRAMLDAMPASETHHP
jgi:uncharacterized protein (DUF305 family)